MRRCLLACVIVVSPIIGVLAFQGTSLAAAPAVNHVSCAPFSGAFDTTTGKISGTASGCTDLANTDSGGTFKVIAGSPMARITWNGGFGTTNFGGLSYAAVSNTCFGPNDEYEVTASVSGGTGNAAKSIKVGWSLQAFLCVRTGQPSYHFTLLPGTELEIGAAY